MRRDRNQRLRSDGIPRHGICLALFFVKMSLGRYEPLTYWSTFTATAIAGTAISDFIDRDLGLGYALGSLILLVALCLVLVVWHSKERSLSVENIRTPAVEAYYWAAFLIANTLGTAAGDFLADDLGAGFLQGALIIGGVLVLVAMLHHFTRTSSVVLFWIAFVLTRPFGATFGDLLTKPSDGGGLALGAIGASAFFAVALAVALYFEIGRERALPAAS